jgi:rhodanese-related sulfurtransferase
MKAYQLFTMLVMGILFSTSAMSVDLPTRKDKNYVSPTSVAGATTVDAAKAYELWQNRAVFIDPRKPGQFEAGRIPGAINLVYGPGKPDQPFNQASLEAEVAKSDPVVFYCNAEECDRSSWTAALAVEWGWQEVYYFRDGYPSWAAAGYPVE